MDEWKCPYPEVAGGEVVAAARPVVLGEGLGDTGVLGVDARCHTGEVTGGGPGLGRRSALRAGRARDLRCGERARKQRGTLVTRE